MSTRSFSSTDYRNTHRSARRGGSYLKTSASGSQVFVRKLVIWLIYAALVVPSTLAAPPLEAGSSPRPPVQCQSFVFTWRGGTPPFTVSVLPADSSDTPLEQHGGIGSGSFQWLADFPAGASVRLEVEDSSGASVDAGPLTIQAGSDASCLSPSGEAQPQSSSAADDPPSSPPAIPPTSTEVPVDSPASSPTQQSPSDNSSPSSSEHTPTSAAAVQGTTTAPTGTAATANPSQTTPSATGSSPLQGSAPANTALPNSSVTPTRSPTGVSGSDAPSASSLLSASTLGGAGSDPTASGTPQPEPTLPVSHTTPLSIGVIVGVVLGVALILIILILLFVWRRRRRATDSADREKTAADPPSRSTSRDSVEAKQVSEKPAPSVQGSSKLLRSVSVSARQHSAASTVRTDSTGARASLGSLVDEMPVANFDAETPTKSLSRSSNTGVATRAESVPAPTSSTTHANIHSTLDVSTSVRPSHHFSYGDSFKRTPIEHPPPPRNRNRRRRASPPLVAADGGVRLAGGPPGGTLPMPDDPSESLSYMLPPPYSRYS